MADTYEPGACPVCRRMDGDHDEQMHKAAEKKADY